MYEQSTSRPAGPALRAPSPPPASHPNLGPAGTTSSPAAGGQSPAPVPRRLTDWVPRAAVIYLLSRVVTTAALITGRLVTGQSWTVLIGRWDAHWYLDVAQHGYPTTTGPLPGMSELRLAFFPLYPLLLRPLVDGVAHPLIVATLATAVLGLGATVAVHRLAAVLADRSGREPADIRRSADRAALLFAVFPGSLVLSLAYTESLAILLLLGCLLALLRRRWALAGLLAALATAARPNALAVVPACGWAAWQAIRLRREWRALVAPLLAPAGFVGYLGYLQVHVGNWRAWDRLERRVWHQSLDFSAGLLRELAPGAVLHHLQTADWQYVSVLVGLAYVGIGVTAWLRWRPPGTVNAYVAGVLAITFAGSHIGPRPRMVLLAVPLFLACAEWLRPRTVWMLAGVSAVLTFGMTYLVATGRVIP